MQVKQTDSPTVHSVTNRMIYLLDQTLETSSGKAMLAGLRNSIGRPLSQTIEIWPFMFENLPEDFLSRGELHSKKEIAILTALQLYALYRQGNRSPLRNQEKTSSNNIGDSLRDLREGHNSVAKDRRFNALVTSETYDGLIHHLRQMVQLLKSKKTGETAIDFGKLAQDLYSFLIGNDEKIRIKWARAYYRTHLIIEEEKKDDQK